MRTNGVANLLISLLSKLFVLRGGTYGLISNDWHEQLNTRLLLLCQFTNTTKAYFLMSAKSMEEERFSRLDDAGVAYGTGRDRVGTTGCLEEGPFTDEDFV